MPECNKTRRHPCTPIVSPTPKTDGKKHKGGTCQRTRAYLDSQDVARHVRRRRCNDLTSVPARLCSTEHYVILWNRQTSALQNQEGGWGASQTTKSDGRIRRRSFPNIHQLDSILVPPVTVNWHRNRQAGGCHTSVVMPPALMVRPWAVTLTPPCVTTSPPDDTVAPPAVT